MGTFSLAKQAMPVEFETIVLNDGIDDETESICRQYKEQLNIRYVFTGQRNLDGQIKWRVPGFAINIGARLSKGKVLIISCAEMFHLNDCIAHLTFPVLVNQKRLSIPIARDDQDASFLRKLETTDGKFDFVEFYNNYPHLNIRLPFLMAVSREEFFAIGGYDEDFIGIGYDDNDLVLRLQKTDAVIIKPRRQPYTFFTKGYGLPRNTIRRLPITVVFITPGKIKSFATRGGNGEYVRPVQKNKNP